MAVVRNLMIRAGADFSAITKQANKASGSMKSMQTSVTKACNGMSTALGSLKKAFGALGVGLSVAAIVNFGKEAAAAYDAQAESEVKLAQVMRNTMGATNDQIQSILDLTSAQQALGVVGDEVQLAGAQELATYLSLTDSLQTLIPVMNDMAAQQYGYNATAEQTTTIATMLGKVMNGQVNALSRYGYAFTEAQEAILKNGNEMQRAAVLAEVVEQSVGGMNAALAATPTGRMKQLSNTMGDIKEQFGQAVRTIGTVFLPVLNTVAKVLAAIASLANKVAQAIANVFGGKSAGKDWEYIPAGTAGAMGTAADAMDDLTAAEKKNTKATKEAKKAQEQLQNMSFDTLEILADHSSSASSDSAGTDEDEDLNLDLGADLGGPVLQSTATAAESASEGLSGLERVLGTLKTAWEGFTSKLDLEKIGGAFDRLKESLGRLGDALGRVGGWLWQNILEPLAVWTVNDALPAFLDVLSGALDVLTAVIDAAMPGIEWLWDNFLQPAAEWVGDKFIEALERIAELLGMIADVISGKMSFGEFVQQLSPLEAILGGIGTALLGLKIGVGIFTGLKAAAAVFSGALAAINWPLTLIVIGIGLVIAAGVALYQNWDKVCAKFKEGAEDLRQDWERIKEAFQKLGDKLSELGDRISQRWQNMVDKFKKGGEDLKQDWERIKKFFSDTVQKIKNLLNFTWSFPKPKMPHITWSWSQVGNFLKVPRFHIEWYAKGGIVDAATLFGAGNHLIGAGEAGKEAIVPLERNMGWVTRVADQIRADFAGGAGVLPVTVSGVDEGILAELAGLLAQAAASAEDGRSGTHVAEFNVNGRTFARAIYEDLRAVAGEKGFSLISNFN